MRDDRLRIAVDDAYVAAFGRATCIFAVLEWNAVWCCERMRPGHVRALKRKTAGVIADDLDRLSHRRHDPVLRAACVKSATEFERLVDVRNAIIHGKPGTAPGGEQRLFRDGVPWTPDTVNDAADEFAACGASLNALLHGALN